MRRVHDVFKAVDIANKATVIFSDARNFRTLSTARSSGARAVLGKLYDGAAVSSLPDSPQAGKEDSFVWHWHQPCTMWSRLVPRSADGVQPRFEI